MQARAKRQENKEDTSTKVREEFTCIKCIKTPKSKIRLVGALLRD